MVQTVTVMGMWWFSMWHVACSVFKLASKPSRPLDIPYRLTSPKITKHKKNWAWNEHILEAYANVIFWITGELINDDKALSHLCPGTIGSLCIVAKGLKTVFKALWRGKGFRAPFLPPIWLWGCSLLSPSPCMWRCTFGCPYVWRTPPHRASLARELPPLACLSLTRENKNTYCHIYIYIYTVFCALGV